MTTIEKIAKAAGCDVQSVRLCLQQDNCKFGTAFKAKGSKHYTYILYPEKVKELFGVSDDTTDNSGDIGSRNCDNASTARQAATWMEKRG